MSCSPGRPRVAGCFCTAPDHWMEEHVATFPAAGLPAHSDDSPTFAAVRQTSARQHAPQKSAACEGDVSEYPWVTQIPAAGTAAWQMGCDRPVRRVVRACNGDRRAALVIAVVEDPQREAARTRGRVQLADLELTRHLVARRARETKRAAAPWKEECDYNRQQGRQPSASKTQKRRGHPASADRSKVH